MEHFKQNKSEDFESSSGSRQGTFRVNPDKLSKDEILFFYDLHKRHADMDGNIGKISKKYKKIALYKSCTSFFVHSMYLIYLNTNKEPSDLDNSFSKTCSLDDLVAMGKMETAAIIAKKKFDPISSIKDLIQYSEADDETKNKALVFFRSHLDQIKEQVNIWKKLSDVDIFQQWASGDLTYYDPIIPLEYEWDAFPAFISLVFDKIIDTKKESTANAVNELVERIKIHECNLRELEAKRKHKRLEKETLKRQFAIESAIEDAQRKEEYAQRAAKLKAQQDLEDERTQIEFMSEHRPYPLENGLKTAHQELESFGGSTAQKAYNAKLLARFLTEATEALDVRYIEPKEMGDILFSPKNILALAQAFDVNGQISQQGVLQHDRKSHTETLQNLYAGSDKARATFARLLSQDSGAFLLSSLILNPEHSKTYATFLTRAHRKLEPLKQKIAEFEEGILEFLPEEQIECKKDSDYLDLLEQYEKQSTGLGINKTRQRLISEIRPIFEGGKVKKTIAHDIPTVIRAEKIALPAKWLNILKDGFHISTSPKGAKYIQIHSNKVPLKRFDIKLSAGIQTLQTELAQLRTRASLHQANLGTIKHMTTELGFQMAKSVQGLELAHSEYEIRASLETSELEKSTAFDLAQEKFETRQYQQQSILQTALLAGIHIGGTNENLEATEEITLKHASFGQIKLAPRGYFQSNDFQTVQDAIDTAQRGHNLSHVTPLSDDTEEKTRFIENWSPEAKTKIFIFDAATLNKLSATRGGNGHSWLDFIKCTAGLPDTIAIIPGVVADWEAQGQIPSSENPNTFDQIDRRYKIEGYIHEASATPIRRFLSTASRASMNGGKIELQQNANPNVIIMNTQGDEDLYARIRAIEKLSNEERADAYQEQIHGKGEGEKAINRIIADLPFDASVTIVSDDIRYFNKDAPTKTPQGKKISHLSTASYLGREIQGHELFLRARLKEKHPISLHRIGQEITEYWKERNPEANIFFAPWSNVERLKPENHPELENEAITLELTEPS